MDELIAAKSVCETLEAEKEAIMTQLLASREQVRNLSQEKRGLEKVMEDKAAEATPGMSAEQKNGKKAEILSARANANAKQAEVDTAQSQAAAKRLELRNKDQEIATAVENYKALLNALS